MKRILPLLVAAGLGCLGQAAGAENIVKRVILYETAFESAEGFNPEFELAGQNQWVAEGTGGQGLLWEEFPGFGQQGFVGFFPPTDSSPFTSVFRPINLDPPAVGISMVRFGALMEILPSQFGSNDSFRWSVYNAGGVYLFALDFDTETRQISLILDNKRIVATEFVFDFKTLYRLEIWMDFARGFWTASLNGQVVVNSERMTTLGTPLTLGDIDAVWGIAQIQAPGDNFMAFDNYQVFGEPLASIPPTLEGQGFTPKGEFKLRVNGEEGMNYSIDVTSDMIHWFSLGEFVAPFGGVFDFEDTTSVSEETGFYRVREIPAP